MPIEFPCPQCGKTLRTPDGTAGRQAQCPACQATSVIPTSSVPAYTPTAGAGDSLNPYQSPPPAMLPMGHAIVAGSITPSQFSIGDALNEGYRVYKQIWVMATVATLVAIAVNGVISQVVSSGVIMVIRASQGDVVVTIVAQLLGAIVSIGLQTFLYVGQINFTLRAIRQGRGEIADLFQGGAYTVRAVIGSILLVLLIFACFAFPAGVGLAGGLVFDGQAGGGLILGAVLGTLLGVIPTVWIGLTYGQFMPLIVDRNVSVGEAFSLSRQIMTGNRLSLFGLFLCMIVVQFVGLLAFCVGILFTSAYMSVTLMIAYLMMSGQYRQPTA